MRTVPLTRLGRWLVAAGLLVASLGTPAVASASCVVLPDGGAVDPWASAEAVFVGTVTGVANGNRWATVHVEEVWKGPDQPAEVVVRGGPEGNTATSIDRTYEVAVQYVFGVTIVDGQLEDNACSGTTRTDAIDLEGLRPDDARTPGGAVPTGGDTGLGGMTGPLLVVGLGVGALLAIVFLVSRREA